MPSDLKSLAVMVAGGVLGVGLIRSSEALPEFFNVRDLEPSLIKIPAAGMGVGKDDIPKTTYLLPAAVAVGAYFLL